MHARQSMVSVITPQTTSSVACTGFTTPVHTYQSVHACTLSSQGGEEAEEETGVEAEAGAAEEAEDAAKPKVCMGLVRLRHAWSFARVCFMHAAS